MPTIMILGGYGAVGFYITRYLLQETNVNLIIAGRSKLKAASVASQLSGLNNAAQERVNSMGVDAISHDSLRQAFSKIDAIVVAAPVMEHFTNIVDIAIESGTDCIDLVHTPNKYTYLQSKSVQITEAGCCFVTDVGLYPGIPGILARYALNQKPDATSIRIAILSRPDWAGLAISDELAREQLLASRDVKPGVHKRGKPRSRWRLGGGSKRIDFGEVFGVQSCAPVQLKELEDISAFGQVREVSVWEGGFDSLLATTILPCARLHQRFKPSAQLTLWANGLRSLLRSNAEPPFGAMLKVTANKRRSEPYEFSLFHEDVHEFAAIATTSCISQYLSNETRAPGVWFQGHLMESGRFIDDLKRLGVA